MSELFIVATPIGNLSDVSQRVRDVLESVDFILAEDPRVTLKLLSHIGLQKKVIAYSEHSSESKDRVILENLKLGQNYALVSDAGTPCVSDPGARLVGLAHEVGIRVTPIAGPSAVTALASVFGYPFPALHFWGFFPQKLKKQTQLVEHFLSLPGLHVYFESPYRVLKTFESFILPLKNCRVMVGREMTKKFETYHVGSSEFVFEKIRQDPIKGEYCLGVMKLKVKDDEDDATDETDGS